MEGYNMNDGDMIELPPGFRFHPTDEELVTHYLSHKVLDCNFSTKAVGEVDLNKVEPWDLPWKAKLGEKDWYFFCARDRKYPSGSRTNRATDAGYWKATGKDKAIFRAKILVGMKKTLVFYRGRAPKGEKTNWVMHEYRLERKNSNIPPKTAKKEWVICRVFKKSSGGNKVHILMLERTHDHRLDLPPLMDLSSYENTTVPINTIAGPHVSCFSNLNQEFQEESVPKYSSSDMNSIFSSQINPSEENFHCPDSILKQEQETVSHIFRRNSPYMERNSSAEFSQDIGVNAKISSTITKYEYELTAYDDDQDFPIISTAQIDLDCLWNY